jgi:hypothetical protein
MGGEAQAAAATEGLGLLDGDDLRAWPRKLTLEELAGAGGARHDHALDAGAGEQGDRVGGERLPRDGHQRLGEPLGSVAQTLGLAAGQQESLHR